jgi:uncharacterized membrane protein YbaN (DUF454 family)
MVKILTEERFRSHVKQAMESFKKLKDKFPEDDNFRKISRVYRQMKSLYFRDKVYAVKHLNYLEKYQSSFTEERRALIVQTIEILQKLILHKKLIKEEEKIPRKKGITRRL